MSRPQCSPRNPGSAYWNHGGNAPTNSQEEKDLTVRLLSNQRMFSPAPTSPDLILQALGIQAQTSPEST